jgi:hypothetical protein
MRGSNCRNWVKARAIESTARANATILNKRRWKENLKGTYCPYESPPYSCASNWREQGWADKVQGGVGAELFRGTLALGPPSLVTFSAAIDSHSNPAAPLLGPHLPPPQPISPSPVRRAVRHAAPRGASQLVVRYCTEMPPQIKQDLNRSGWETTDFPSVCERCLPENPYVQMLKEDYGAVSIGLLHSIPAKTNSA